MTISPRQLQLIQKLSDGRRLCEASRELGMSISTAETHISRLRYMAGVRTAFGLAKWCIEKGYIQ